MALYQLLNFRKKSINFLWIQRKGESNWNQISEGRQAPRSRGGGVGEALVSCKEGGSSLVKYHQFPDPTKLKPIKVRTILKYVFFLGRRRIDTFSGLYVFMNTFCKFNRHVFERHFIPVKPHKTSLEEPENIMK